MYFVMNRYEYFNGIEIEYSLICLHEYKYQIHTSIYTNKQINKFIYVCFIKIIILRLL